MKYIQKPNIVTETDYQEYLQYLSEVSDEVDKWPDSEKTPRSVHYSEYLLEK